LRKLIHAVKFLIENKADLNIRNNDWDAPYFELSEYTLQDVRSALMLAAENRHFEIAELLIDAGAKMDFVGKHDCNAPSALSLAAEKGALPIVTLLVNNGANVDSNENEASALLCAVDGNYYEIVKFLMDEGADPKHYDNNGDNPLILAKEEGYKNIFQLLTAKKYQSKPKDELEKSDDDIAPSDSDSEKGPRKRKMSFWGEYGEKSQKLNHTIVAQDNAVAFSQEIASMRI
jgi:ankyrin repeat protein